ncbi:MAG: hypothetical protein IPQ18_11175 [Saprospiraceae bacterium]|jgi:hypothetical protein|nr:hypothetical protein [Saprospiraceae bacterium]MBL0295336.1 hypothetical protein [Saprospiraceae bacterium]
MNQIYYPILVFSLCLGIFGCKYNNKKVEKENVQITKGIVDTTLEGVYYPTMGNFIWPCESETASKITINDEAKALESTYEQDMEQPSKSEPALVEIVGELDLATNTLTLNDIGNFEPIGYFSSCNQLRLYGYGNTPNWNLIALHKLPVIIFKDFETGTNQEFVIDDWTFKPTNYTKQVFYSNDKSKRITIEFIKSQTKDPKSGEVFDYQVHIYNGPKMYVGYGQLF